MNATVPGIAVTGLYCVYSTGPNSAAETPTAPTVDGAVAVSDVKRWVFTTSTTVVICFPSRSTTNGVGPLASRTAATISSG